MRTLVIVLRLDEVLDVFVNNRRLHCVLVHVEEFRIIGQHCGGLMKRVRKITKSCKLLQMLLSELNFVDLHSMMFEENVGAIFLAGNR